MGEVSCRAGEKMRVLVDAFHAVYFNLLVLVLDLCFF